MKISIRVISIAISILVIIIFVVGYIAKRYDDCKESGGILVHGVISYECVAMARKPKKLSYQEALQ